MTRSYHHGDLRRAILDAAIEVITADGPSAVSLRDLARRAGVSHAAPAHHFTDKAGLLAAIAIEGYDLLATALEEAVGPGPVPTDGLREQGVRYVRFAVDHPAHFAVMFSPDLYRDDLPELVAARARTNALLRGAVAAVPGSRRRADADLAGLAAWSLAHGFATLYNGGNLTRAVGAHDPSEAFRAVAAVLFGPSPA